MLIYFKWKVDDFYQQIETNIEKIANYSSIDFSLNLTRSARINVR